MNLGLVRVSLISLHDVNSNSLEKISVFTVTQLPRLAMAYSHGRLGQD